MKTNYLSGLFLMLFFGLVIISGCKKQELEIEPAIEAQDSNVELESRSFKYEEWFENFLIDSYGQETAETLVKTYSIEWDQLIRKNKNTVVIPTGQFLELEDYISYTRLVLSKNESGKIEPYFYGVVPMDQTPKIYTDEDVKSFDGFVFTVELLTGFLDVTEFANGIPIKFYQGERGVQGRCCVPWIVYTTAGRVNGIMRGWGFTYTGNTWDETDGNWGGGNGNSSYNPIDVEGLNGMNEELFENLVNQFSFFSEFSFEQLVHVISTDCLKDESGNIVSQEKFNECAQESLDVRRRLSVRMWFIENGLDLAGVDFLDYIQCVDFNNLGESTVNAECLYDIFYNELISGFDENIVTHLNENAFFRQQVIFFLEDNSYDEVSNSVAELVSRLDMEELLYTEYGAEWTAIENEVINDFPWDIYTQQLFWMEFGSLKVKNPNWSNIRVALQAYYNVINDALHLSLDIAGLVPVIGEVADITNGILYTVEGDGINATLSFAGAIPGSGWAATGAKWAHMAVFTTTGTKATLKFIVRESDNIITFGRRAQLKTIIKPAANHQAHHIIPWEHGSHAMVQKAAKVKGNPFHMNDHLNGIPLHTNVHNGSHGNYNNWIKDRLDEIDDQLSDKDTLTAIENIINQVRTTIASSPSTKINELFIP